MTWKLDDGSEMTYFNWAPTDPDGGANQLCLALYNDQWVDTYCAPTFLPWDPVYYCMYVCEA